MIDPYDHGTRFHKERSPLLRAIVIATLEHDDIIVLDIASSCITNIEEEKVEHEPKDD